MSVSIQKVCDRIADDLRARPGKKAKLDKRDPDEHFGLDDVSAADLRQDKNVLKISELADKLYADGRRSLLIILQGMDTSGKDGTIRHLLTGVNPQCCDVTSFKVPSSEELAHDFLWRVHQRVPARGRVGVFNRSHYEDVLVVRVHELVPEGVWRERFRLINDFERLLVSTGTVVLKFFLHISKDEQKLRLESRLKDPAKNWKMNLGDLKERERWDEYMQAYEEAITECSTEAAPWYVIPSNRKWIRNLAISQIVVDTLGELDLRYPKLDFDPKKVRVQ